MKFEIKYYDTIGKVCYYTIQLEGKEENETALFFKRFIEDERFSQDVAEIRALLLTMGRFGAREQRFHFRGQRARFARYAQ